MSDQKTVKKVIRHLENRDIDKVVELKMKIMPKSLYRFYKLCDNTLSSLENRAIWLSNYKNLNDPFESIVNLDFDNYMKKWDYEQDFLTRTNSKLMPDEIERLYKSETPHETYWDICQNRQVAGFERPKTEILKKQMEALAQSPRSMAYIGCFTEEVHSLLMWSHYADSGKGISVEYCTDYIDHSYLHPVYYSNTIHTSSPKKSDIPVRNLIKGKDWQYEKEWRIVYYSLDFNESNQYYKLPLPKKLILGPLFEENDAVDKEKLRKIAHQTQIPIVKTALHKSEYKLIVED